jgi:hypothetical protein
MHVTAIANRRTRSCAAAARAEAASFNVEVLPGETGATPAGAPADQLDTHGAPSEERAGTAAGIMRPDSAAAAPANP